MIKDLSSEIVKQTKVCADTFKECKGLEDEAVAYVARYLNTHRKIFWHILMKIFQIWKIFLFVFFNISRLCSHWSSSYFTALLLVESFIVMKYFHSDATPALLCHKEPAKGTPTWVISCLSLVLYGVREVSMHRKVLLGVASIDGMSIIL